jgi:hypothetical protein
MDMKELKQLTANNCQMLLTEELLNHLESKSIETNITREDLEIKSQIKQIATDIFTDEMTDREKVYATVNYVVNNMNYDYGISNDGNLLSEANENAFKYCLQGNGCCRQFTAITTALLQEAGMEVYEVLSDGHIWNLVKVEGEYYWLDSTLVEVEPIENLEERRGYLTVDFSEILMERPLSLPKTYYQQIRDLPDSNDYHHPNLGVDYMVKNQVIFIPYFTYDIINVLHYVFLATAILIISCKIARKIKEKRNRKKEQEVLSTQVVETNPVTTPNDVENYENLTQ